MNTEKERESNIPKVYPKTSLSDPGTPLIAHSLEKEKRLKKRLGWGRERSREEESEWGGVKGPCRHLKSWQARTPSPDTQQQIHTFHQWPVTHWNTCSICSPLTCLHGTLYASGFVFMPHSVGEIALFTVNREWAGDGNRRRERSGGASNGISLIQYLLIKQNYFL